MSLAIQLLAAILLAQEAAPENPRVRRSRLVEKSDGSVELTVTDTAADGTSRTSTYRAASADEFRRKHPGLAKEHGVGEELGSLPFALPWAGWMREWIAPSRPLGIRVAPLPEALKAQLGVDGLLVADLEAGGRGAVAGLQKHDILLKLNGVPVGGTLAFRAAVSRQGDGDLRLEVLRRGKPVDVLIKSPTSS